MKRLLTSLAFLLCVSAFGAVPQKPINANFEGDEVQWHINTKVGNTPAIVATMYQGTNLWDATGWTAIFKYGKNRSSGSMVSITGTVSTSTITFQANSNSFAMPVENWYSAILLTTNGFTESSPEGLITVERSPEVDAGQLFVTYAISGGLYSFSGNFTNWPFLWDGDGGQIGDIAYFSGTNWIRLSPGVSGEFLSTGGTNAVPSWGAPAGGGTVTNVTAGTNIVITGTSTLNPTINTDGSLQSAIDLNSATGASHTASIAANSASITVLNTNAFLLSESNTAGAGTTNTFDYAAMSNHCVLPNGRVDWFGADGFGADGISSVYIGPNAGLNGDGNNAFYLFNTAGRDSTGDNSLYCGREAGRQGAAEYTIHMGSYAGKNSSGSYKIYMDAYAHQPPSGHDGTNDAIYIDDGELYLGRATGTTHSVHIRVPLGTDLDGGGHNSTNWANVTATTGNFDVVNINGELDMGGNDINGVGGFAFIAAPATVATQFATTFPASSVTGSYGVIYHTVQDLGELSGTNTWTVTTPKSTATMTNTAVLNIGGLSDGLGTSLSMELAVNSNTNLTFGSGIFTVGDFYLVDGVTNIISFEVFNTNRIYATAIEVQ